MYTVFTQIDAVALAKFFMSQMREGSWACCAGKVHGWPSQQNDILRKIILTNNGEIYSF